MDSVPPSYQGHRFPLSYREAGELLQQRGVIVSHKTVRR